MQNRRRHATCVTNLFDVLQIELSFLWLALLSTEEAVSEKQDKNS